MVRVLADWHHPALWESLRILFEDRFGWQLYSMVGMDWHEKGFWRFENRGIGLDYDHFLFEGGNSETDWAWTGGAPHLVGDHYEIEDPDYPGHVHKLVTMEQARDFMPWGFVVATVSIHQISFRMLAESLGARFIYQIGNPVQDSEWRPEDRVIASVVESKIKGNGVVYHQEFDLNMFRYEPPTTTKTIVSTMLRMDWTKDWGLWLAAKRDLRGFRLNAYGVDSPFLRPQSKVAEAIRGAGWIWHDKELGDGFGHAIHNAAACGRPLIGHARYYFRTIAEPLWIDGVTCIDLDRHSPPEAFKMIEEISESREKHLRMCETIYSQFKQIVDFDKEAEQIKELLA